MTQSLLALTLVTSTYRVWSHKEHACVFFVYCYVSRNLKTKFWAWQEGFTPGSQMVRFRWGTILGLGHTWILMSVFTHGRGRPFSPLLAWISFSLDSFKCILCHDKRKKNKTENNIFKSTLNFESTGLKQLVILLCGWCYSSEELNKSYMVTSFLKMQIYIYIFLFINNSHAVAFSDCTNYAEESS